MQKPVRWAEGRRLLFVVNEAYFFVSHRLAVARAARRAGFEVHVAAPVDHVWAPEDFDVTQLADEGFSFHPIPLNRRGINPLQDLQTLAALWRLSRRLRPDLVHNLTIKPVLYGGIVNRLLRTRGVVAAVPGLGQVFLLPGIRAALLRRLIVTLYRLSLNNPRSRVIVQNPDDGDRLLMFGAVAPARLALIRGSGVPLDQFALAEEEPGPPLVILPARLIWAKGIKEFVAAARRLRDEGIAGRFAILGDAKNDYPDAVSEAQLRRWHEEGVIEWWGRREDMPEVMRQCHVVCLPSKYGEGVPRVLIEAAATGRAIVTTDIPGCREIVRNDENGILVPPGDVEALSEALKRVLRDDALRRRFGTAGRKIAEHDFAIDSVVGKTFNIYRALLDADFSDNETTGAFSASASDSKARK